MMVYYRIYTTCLLLVIYTFITITCFSQAQVTGHVFAEIVETAGAEVQLKNYISPGIDDKGLIHLGEITVTNNPKSCLSVLIGVNDDINIQYQDEVTFELSDFSFSNTNAPFEHNKQTYKLNMLAENEFLYSSPSTSKIISYHITIAYN